LTKGRWPLKAIARAKKIAEERGVVRVYERGPGLHPHFSIVTPHMLSEVMIRITDHINAPLSQQEADAAAEIGSMILYPVSPQISREIWFSSQNYTKRYFRITGTGLIELAPDGSLLPIDVAKSGTGAEGMASAAPAPSAAIAGTGASTISRQVPATEYPEMPVPAPEHSGVAVPSQDASPESPASSSPDPFQGPALVMPSESPVPAPASPGPAPGFQAPVPARESPAPGSREQVARAAAHPPEGTLPGRSTRT
jgi:hypothetical protein